MDGGMAAAAKTVFLRQAILHLGGGTGENEDLHSPLNPKAGHLHGRTQHHRARPKIKTKNFRSDNRHA